MGDPGTIGEVDWNKREPGNLGMIADQMMELAEIWPEALRRSSRTQSAGTIQKRRAASPLFYIPNSIV